MTARSSPIPVATANVIVANGGSTLIAQGCAFEKIVTVYVKNPAGSGQTLTVQFLQSMDGVEYIDLGEQGMIDIPAGEARLKVFDVDGINYFEIIAVPSGAGINNVPFKVYIQI